MDQPRPLLSIPAVGDTVVDEPAEGRAARLNAWSQRELPLGWWLLGAALVGGFVWFRIQAWGISLGDYTQDRLMVQYIWQGRWADAYGASWPFQSSPPGYPLYVTPFFNLTKGAIGTGPAFKAPGFASYLWLGIAMVFASRAARVPRRSVRELVGLALAVGSVPVIACVNEWWHPQDIFALALTMGGYAAITRRKVWLAAVLFGFALLSRQWAISIIAVIFCMVDAEDRKKLIVGVGGICIVFTLPFLIANPSDTFKGIAGGPVSYRATTIPGRLATGSMYVRALLSRIGPLVGTAATCLYLLHRKVRYDPVIALWAMTVSMAARYVLDSAGYVYYLAPLAAMLALCGERRWRWPVVSFLAGILFTYVHHDEHSPWIGWTLNATTSAIVVIALVFTVRGFLRSLPPVDDPADADADAGASPDLAPT